MTPDVLSILMLNWKDPHGRGAGGSETMVRRCAESWATAGHRVTVFVPRLPGASSEEVINRVRYVRAGQLHTVFTLGRQYLRRHRRDVDVVIDSVSGRPFFAHHVVGDRATAIVHHVCAEQWQSEYRFPISWLGRYVIEPWWLRKMRTARVVVMSDSTEQDLARFGVHAASRVTLGVDIPANSGPRRAEPRKAPRIVFLGRLIRAKRPLDAVLAVQRIRAVYPCATLDIAGQGYLIDDLKALHVPGVTVHGFVTEKEKHKLLSEADLLLMPGTKEGWGIVNIEAAAHGVPVVGYDIPGVRDSVLHGRTGVLTPPSPEALGSAALSLLGDPQRWRAYSICAARRARTFTWSRTAASLLVAATAPSEVTVVPAPGRARPSGLTSAPSDVGLEPAMP